ncbi:unnamed protein product [Rotaria sp. Silwood2]|nr:unnamed protein product [Rotaria sp. Silwood2]CAF4215435.1 unnamed protein product [Rotaria sp. Silwood2]
MAKFFLHLLLFSSVYILSNNAIKVGCRYYNQTGRVVAGGNGYGPALNQFFTNRFYLDDSKNIYLFDRSSSIRCEWRFLIWSANSSQGRPISDGCTTDAVGCHLSQIVVLLINP